MKAEEPELTENEETVDSGGEQAEHAEDFDRVLEEAIENAAEPPPTDNERVAEAEREVLRVRAEMENFRKRMQRDSDQQLKYANMSIVRDLLDVVDNLNRATEAAQGEEHAAGLLDGVKMVSQQFISVLGKFGCKKIESLGAEFDPNFHEAIAQMASSEFESGKVMQEVAVGYVLHDRVVRPSSVIVSTGAPEQESADQQ